MMLTKGNHSVSGFDAPTIPHKSRQGQVFSSLHRSGENRHVGTGDYATQAFYRL